MVSALGACERDPAEERLNPARSSTNALVATLSEDGAPFSADPSGAAFTADQGVVFVDRVNQRAVKFDSTGRMEWSFGRRGQGPGEFFAIDRAIALGGDTVFIFDSGRQVGYQIVKGTISGSSVAFDRWGFGQLRGLQLIGRFEDGRWVALRTQPSSTYSIGVRAVTDTPQLVAGRADETPKLIASLSPIRAVEAATSSYLARLYVQEVAPNAVSVCQRGVVILDTSGVRLIDPAGKTIAKLSKVAARRPIRGRIAEEIVASVIRDVPQGLHAERAAVLLRDLVKSADSLADQGLIDVAGGVWIVQRARTGTKYNRIDSKGDVTGELRDHSPLLIGNRILISMDFDSTTESMAYRVSRLPRAQDTYSPLGRCGGTSRY